MSYNVEVIVDKKNYNVTEDYFLILQCTKAGGWSLWRKNKNNGKETEIGNEFDNDLTINIKKI